MKTVGVVGAGAWGTALACASVRAGLSTKIWARENDVVRSINETHENNLFLKHHTLPESLQAVGDITELKSCDIILLVSPAQHLRRVSETLAGVIAPGTPVAICSKGIEVSTGQLMSQILTETMTGHPVMVLSGPTFASEVARGLPCALTLACEDEQLSNTVAEALGQPTFRLYTTTDLAGAQIGGAIKNVLAIATGMVDGLQFGENARAAVITRGLAEVMRFGALFGAHPETLMGLSGLGDLILTCSSTQSRNMSLGKEIGQGRTLSDIMKTRNSVAEGAHTVEIVHKIAEDNKIDIPICNAVYSIIKQNKNVKEVTRDLLDRPFTREAI